MEKFNIMEKKINEDIIELLFEKVDRLLFETEFADRDEMIDNRKEIYEHLKVIKELVRMTYDNRIKPDF